MSTRPVIYPDYNKYNFFITLEGLDATYKETNAKVIASYIKEDFKKYIDKFGLQVKIVSFPRYKSQASYFVRQYLKGKYVDSSDLSLVSSLFLLDMYDWYENARINKFFSRPSIVIFDRYWYSMLYYLDKNVESVYRHVQDPEEYIKTNQHAIFSSAHNWYKLPVTDVLVKLQNNNMRDISSKLSIRNKDKETDIYESDTNYLGFVRNVFNTTDFSPYVSAKYSSHNNIPTINVENKDRNKVKEEIIEAIKPSLIGYKRILCKYKK